MGIPMGLIWNGSTQQLRKLEDRVAVLEARLGIKPPTATFENSLRIHTGYEPKSSPLAMRLDQPWVSKSVRISEQLTSFEFAVKAQLGQAVLFALGGLTIGALVARLFELSWLAAPGFGLAAGSLALTILLIDHRGLVHRIVNDTNSRAQKKRTELRVQIDHHQGPLAKADFLYVAGIQPDQLRQFAQATCDGVSLTFHAHAGGGKLFSQPQYAALMAELERFDYARPGAGNKPRTLTSKGKALMRALAEG